MDPLDAAKGRSQAPEPTNPKSLVQLEHGEVLNTFSSTATERRQRNSAFVCSSVDHLMILKKVQNCLRKTTKGEELHCGVYFS